MRGGVAFGGDVDSDNNNTPDPHHNSIKQGRSRTIVKGHLQPHPPPPPPPLPLNPPLQALIADLSAELYGSAWAAPYETRHCGGGVVHDSCKVMDSKKTPIMMEVRVGGGGRERLCRDFARGLVLFCVVLFYTPIFSFLKAISRSVFSRWLCQPPCCHLQSRRRLATRSRDTPSHALHALKARV